MEASVESTRRALAALRSGRANPELLDRVQVDAYGSSIPVAQLAQVGVQPPRGLVITPHDPTLLSAIERSLAAAGLGAQPSNDGQRIRLALPAPSQERREQLARQARSEAETGRVAVRNARRDAINALRRAAKAGEISDAKLNGRSRDVQELTDQHVAQVDALLERALADIAGG